MTGTLGGSLTNRKNSLKLQDLILTDYLNREFKNQNPGFYKRCTTIRNDGYTEACLNCSFPHLHPLGTFKSEIMSKGLRFFKRLNPTVPESDLIFPRTQPSFDFSLTGTRGANG